MKNISYYNNNNNNNNNNKFNFFEPNPHHPCYSSAPLLGDTAPHTLGTTAVNE